MLCAAARARFRVLALPPLRPSRVQLRPSAQRRAMSRRLQVATLAHPACLQVRRAPPQEAHSAPAVQRALHCQEEMLLARQVEQHRTPSVAALRSARALPSARSVAARAQLSECSVVARALRSACSVAALRSAQASRASECSARALLSARSVAVLRSAQASRASECSARALLSARSLEVLRSARSVAVLQQVFARARSVAAAWAEAFAGALALARPAAEPVLVALARWVVASLVAWAQVARARRWSRSKSKTR